MIYFLVNTPFKAAYHNYRAGLCHITIFIILFVTMYYRSMKVNHTLYEKSYTFTPAYIELSAILLCAVVSIVILFYDIYQWLKKKLQKSLNKNKVLNTSNDEGHHLHMNRYEFENEDVSI